MDVAHALIIAIFVVAAIFAIARVTSALLPRESYIDTSNFSQGYKAQCIVVNMDRNRDRLTRITTEYAASDLAASLELRRFAAVDARLASFDVSRYVTEKTLAQIETTAKTGYRLRHHEMTVGAVGCFLSHVTVMRMLLQDDAHDVYVIFEDDAVIPPSVRAQIDRAIRGAPRDWDLVLLGYHYATFNEEDTDETFDKLATFWGTHAYIVNKQGAQKIVDDYQNEKIRMQVDSMLSLMIKRKQLNAYALKDVLVSPGHFGSEIQVPVKAVEGIDPFEL